MMDEKVDNLRIHGESAWNFSLSPSALKSMSPLAEDSAAGWMIQGLNPSRPDPIALHMQASKIFHGIQTCKWQE